MVSHDSARPDDHQLMARLAGGDDPALEELIDRWKTPLTSYLWRMTGNGTVAADLAQETFVKLYLARERWRPSGKFSTYLFTIASNLARNHFRFAARHPTVSIDPPADGGNPTAADPVDPSLPPDAAAAGREREREILAAIAGLPEPQRTALSLSLHEDLGIDAIAEILGCSAKAVDNHLYRARRSLREKLAHLAG